MLDFHLRTGTHETALAVAERLGDGDARACTHRLISTACFRPARRTEAIAHLQHALTLGQELGDPACPARASPNLISRAARPFE
ncbi:hypothetical protein [Saccharothrix sp.]|uniref:hypothetical protein n=1 Tax=Saccharothrix sp. TaxID=1873460 RepID=UPI00281151DA|nr:hypothetical protein [Saccharothrix sp.]